VPLSNRPYATLLASDGLGEMPRASEEHDRQEIFPVVDPQGRLLGIIAGADLLLLAEEPQLQGLVNAAGVMHPSPDVRPEHGLRHAFDALRAAGVTQLPVLDGERRILGLIDEGAIAPAYMLARTAGEPERPERRPQDALGS
jgi:CBS domain-containing protein